MPSCEVIESLGIIYQALCNILYGWLVLRAASPQKGVGSKTEIHEDKQLCVKSVSLSQVTLGGSQLLRMSGGSRWDYRQLGESGKILLRKAWNAVGVMYRVRLQEHPLWIHSNKLSNHWRAVSSLVGGVVSSSRMSMDVGGCFCTPSSLTGAFR